jgi:hypothetical protein
VADVTTPLLSAAYAHSLSKLERLDRARHFYDFVRGLLFAVPQKHGWRSTLRFHIKDEQFCGLGVTGIAAHDVYIRGRFVKDLAGVNGLGTTTLHLSNDASF